MARYNSSPSPKESTLPGTHLRPDPTRRQASNKAKPKRKYRQRKSSPSKFDYADGYSLDRKVEATGATYCVAVLHFRFSIALVCDQYDKFHIGMLRNAQCDLVIVTTAESRMLKLSLSAFP